MVAWVEMLVMILKFVLITGFSIWILYMIFWVFFKIFNKQRRLWIFYKILGRKYDEKDVAWCMEAINGGLSELDVRKHLLLKGTESKRVEEVIFIFTEISRELVKGGNLKHGGSEKSDGKIELPEIEKEKN